MNRTERNVFIYDLVVRARAQHAIPPRASEIVSVLAAMLERNQCSNARERGTVIYRIAELATDAALEVVTILVRRCDTNAANAVYSHRQTGAARIVAKTDDEGGDRAAHIVISSKPQTGQAHTYLCMMEGVPGIHHLVVQALINSVLRDAAKADVHRFEYPDPAGAVDDTGSIKMHQYVPNVELRGHLSDSLEHDLDEGTVSNLELIKAQPAQQLGGNAYLLEDRLSLKVHVEKTLPRGGRLQSLLSAMQSKRSQYKEGRIQFVDPNGSSKSVAYDLDTGTPLQQMYVRYFKIDRIVPPMDESSERIVPSLADRIVHRLVSERI